MEKRILYVLLALSMMMAIVATVYADDSDDTFENEIELFEEFLAEKRARGKSRKLRAKWRECPDNPICFCLVTPNGSVVGRGTCAQTNAQNIGI
ncbi:hypothetical protein HOLleu_22496 [Holothuria leucospilota]|uniref:Uncharacterized protein n=1 Tax=Holothuria leucospilota TaxID=206669 RepID=A0A9Q1BXQ4_HOLLE|nr:hypothetical protein HOLleu_22496 [Holothuria leucospilota]